MQHILRIIACESDNVFINQRVENAMLHSEHSIFNVLAERKKSRNSEPLVFVIKLSILTYDHSAGDNG